MKETIDLIAREAFERMIAEAGYPRADRIPPAPATGVASRRPGRSPAVLAFVAAAFCAFAVIPLIAARGRPGFAERAASLPANPQLTIRGAPYGLRISFA